MCNKHYASWWLSTKGRMSERRPYTKRVVGALCSVEECSVLAGRRGLCDAHYTRLRRYGDVNAFKRPSRARCLECGDRAAARQLCKKHYQASVANPKRQQDRSALRSAYARHTGGACDLCGAPDAKYLDHDHGHCPGTIGCAECIRGALCQACNLLEGTIKAALSKGVITEVSGPLAEYLANPPFQRWWGERADGGSLAA
mgnify:CR=1 FL=1